MLALSTLAACAHATTQADDQEGNGELVVVERSKARAPDWAKLPSGELSETPQDLRLLTLRSKLLNLPLGLKQTQMNGLDATRVAVAARLKNQLLTSANTPTTALSANARAALQRVVAATADAGVSHYGKISDLYYEGVDNHLAGSGDPMAHYYIVYILVTFPKDKLPYLYRDLATRLSHSGEASLQPLVAVAMALSGPVG